MYHNGKSDLLVCPPQPLQIPDHMWCPTTLDVNGKVTEYPVPEPYLPINFIRSTGMRYQAEEVRQCLLKGTFSTLLNNSYIITKRNKNFFLKKSVKCAW